MSAGVGIYNGFFTRAGKYRLIWDAGLRVNLLGVNSSIRNVFFLFNVMWNHPKMAVKYVEENYEWESLGYFWKSGEVKWKKFLNQVCNDAFLLFLL